jgi:uncharacterized protein YdaU (DUF1376 family)
VDQCYSIARAATEQERANDFVLSPYFIKQDKFFENGRATRVIAEAHEKHEKRVNAGPQKNSAPLQRQSDAASSSEQSSSNAPAIPPADNLQPEPQPD